MIFVTLGSQKFQFNRLLKEIDKLVEDGQINEEVFAQIGYSDYKPIRYQYKEFLDRDEFVNIMSKCNKVITHGGTGAIVSAVKKGKKVIAIPRLAEYEEHVDDHQLQIVSQFESMGLIKGIRNINELGIVVESINDITLNEYKSNTNNIIKNINEYLQNLSKV